MYSGMKVLFVSDAPPILAFARSRLRSDGVDVTCATSGWEALTAARDESPDLIVLDDRLSDLPCAELSRQLQARPASAGTPILFLVEAGDAAAKQRALDMGGVDFVTRPLDAAELRVRVRGALRTKRLGDLLVRYARIDPLTELPDRRALEERLGDEWARRERHGGLLSVVLLEPDDLGGLRETYGTQAGDRALVALGQMLREAVRPSDRPARFDETRFGVVLPETGGDGALAFARRCRGAVARIELPLDGAAVRVTVTFGAATAVGRPSAAALLAAAEGALRHARAAGPSRIAVHDGSGATLADEPDDAAESASTAPPVRARARSAR